jgi:hypothetical protein
MTMRERFSDSEWQELLHIPFDGFLMVALADKHVDKEEVAAFLETLARAGELKDQMHREIAMDLATRGSAGIAGEMSFEANETGPQMAARVERSKAVLKDKLTQQEYESFLGSVLMNALAVAAATGKRRMFHKKQMISDDEARALAVFCTAWDINPAEALTRYGVLATH